MYESDESLIEAIDIETGTADIESSASISRGFHLNGLATSTAAADVHVTSSTRHHHQSTNRTTVGVANAIMMYSPYIPSVELIDSRTTDIGNYYERIETEETVKCIVTSALFLGVVVCILLVAILKNPGM